MTKDLFDNETIKRENQEYYKKRTDCYFYSDNPKLGVPVSRCSYSDEYEYDYCPCYADCPTYISNADVKTLVIDHIVRANLKKSQKHKVDQNISQDQEQKKFEIHISYGRTYGDETTEYIVTFTDGMTVQDFITEWLTTKPEEWGYFQVRVPDTTWINYPTMEYEHGDILTNNITEYLDKKLIKVSGSGGWTRSDFIFTV